MSGPSGSGAVVVLGDGRHAVVLAFLGMLALGNAWTGFDLCRGPATLSGASARS
jgi:hypothetical protein